MDSRWLPPTVEGQARTPRLLAPIPSDGLGNVVCSQLACGVSGAGRLLVNRERSTSTLAQTSLNSANPRHQTASMDEPILVRGFDAPRGRR